MLLVIRHYGIGFKSTPNARLIFSGPFHHFVLLR